MTYDDETEKELAEMYVALDKHAEETPFGPVENRLYAASDEISKALDAYRTLRDGDDE